MSKIYIAGPMTGLEDFNFPAFFAAEEMLHALGHECFNPAQMDLDVDGFDGTGMTGQEVIWSEEQMRGVVRRDVDAIFECQGVYMLKGWERSVGARAEHALAVWLRLEIKYQ